jgi:hypothetical protein
MKCFDFSGSAVGKHCNIPGYLRLLEFTLGNWQICLKLKNCANPGYSRVFERKIPWAALEKLGKKSYKTIATGGGPGAQRIIEIF